MKEMPKQLLYYDHFTKMPKHFCGEPIYQFYFKDVKTLEDVILGECSCNEEVSNILGGHYYQDITLA